MGGRTTGHTRPRLILIDGYGKSEYLAQKIEVCSPRLQVAALDPVSYLDDCAVDRCTTAALSQLGDHQSIDVVDLTVPTLGPVVHDGGIRVRQHESCAQRVEQELDGRRRPPD